MAERFDIRRIMREARGEATELGSPRVEAEHILLALSRRSDVHAGRLLADSGIGHDTVRQALDLEFERSLNAVGIRLDAFALPEVRSSLGPEARALGQSGKTSLQGALKSRVGRGRNRRLTSLNLLLGILTPDLGTVARALEAIDIDRGALIAEVRTTLAQAA